MRPSACSSLVFVYLAVAAASALHAQSSARSYSADELCSASLEDGETVIVTGKYKELIDEELYLFDCGLPLRLEDPRLFARLLEFTPKKDNLTVVGVVAQIRGERVIRVRELKSAPGDFALFQQEYEALERLPADERIDRLIRLGRRILREGRRRANPHLSGLARHVFRDALALEAERSTSDTVKTRIERIREVDTWLRDPAFARDLVLPILAEAPDNAEAVAFLRQLGCRKYGGRWITYEEYKRLEGLVQHEGRWVTPRERHHLRALEEFARQPKSNLILLRRRTDKEYVLVAEEGRVETGMRREEVCLALGFPDYVLRRAYDRKEFDQWSYGDRYYYFYDGILVFVPPK